MIHRTKIFQNWQQKYMEVIFYQEYVQIKNVRRRFDPVRWSKGRGPTKLNVDVAVGCRPGVIDWSRTIASYADTVRVFKNSWSWSEFVLDLINCFAYGLWNPGQ